MPAENGLPQYVSKHAKPGLYKYYRRPPTGLKCPAFVRSFGTKDRKVMMSMYAAIYTEAEAHFERHRTGLTMTEREIAKIAYLKRTGTKQEFVGVSSRIGILGPERRGATKGRKTMKVSDYTYLNQLSKRLFKAGVKEVTIRAGVR